jgi:peptidoglycan hydrolase-like protein with peptidoglycan-binding domain
MTVRRAGVTLLIAVALALFGGLEPASHARADARLSDEQIARAAAADAPLLAIGSTGPAVAAWQAEMNTWLDVTSPTSSFRLEIDGVYGRLTDSMTRRFQFAQDLPVDGLVGPATRAAFLSAPALIEAGRSPVVHEPFVGLGDRGDAVATWQTGLNRWLTATGSLEPLTVDGIFGPATLAATQTFQVTQGITVDRLAGPETLAALASAPALVNVVPNAPPGLPTPSPAEQPAAGVCSSNDAPIAELVLGPDAPMPRCLSMSGDQWLRIANDGGPTTVTLGTWSIDLERGAASTSPLPVGAYVDRGAHGVAVTRYAGSGPDLVVR